MVRFPTLGLWEMVVGYVGWLVSGWFIGVGLVVGVVWLLFCCTVDGCVRISLLVTWVVVLGVGFVWQL